MSAITVAEVIEELSKLPPQLLMYFDCPRCGQANIFSSVNHVAVVETKYGKDKAQMMTPQIVSIPELAEWEDADVQAIYEILCDQLKHKPMEQHWEGYCARWAVAKVVKPYRERIARLEAELERTKGKRK